MTRYFFDTEFIEYPCTIDLISIGIVSEVGNHELYLESNEVDWSKAHPWVLENVKPHLIGHGIPKVQIAEEIKRFCVGYPEFWAYFGDYDWVVFCWLFGSMVDMPPQFPHMCMDLQQLAKSMGIPSLKAAVPQDGTEHNALDDARWNLKAYQFLTRS